MAQYAECASNPFRGVPLRGDKPDCARVRLPQGGGELSTALSPPARNIRKNRPPATRGEGPRTGAPLGELRERVRTVTVPICRALQKSIEVLTMHMRIKSTRILHCENSMATNLPTQLSTWEETVQKLAKDYRWD